MVEDAAAAVDEAWHRLLSVLKGPPSLVICAANSGYDAERTRSRLMGLAPPGCAIAGMSSCLGAMNERGLHTDAGKGMSIIAFTDLAGDYGVGLCLQGDDPAGAGARAVRQAIDRAGRAGELPELVWLSAAPGREEAVLQGIASVIGPHVPVLGGSSADNNIAGDWWQFSDRMVSADGVLAVVFYPSCPSGFSFHSGYAPTAHSGIATSAGGRVVREIDNEPAARIYDSWTDGLISEHIDGGNILAASTFHPLGLEAGRIEDVPYYALVHPERVLEDGSISMFSDVPEGAEVTLMHGSADSLVHRAGSVVKGVIERQGRRPSDVAGSLLVYCAGCMLGIQQRMDEVVGGIRRAQGDAPFQGVFTFGEQGCFADGVNRHANLMILAVVFFNRP